MANFNPNQIRQQIDNAQPNPRSVYSALGNIVNNSSTCRAKVESINPSTGEYRITLTGTYSGSGSTPNNPGSGSWNDPSDRNRNREDH